MNEISKIKTPRFTLKKGIWIVVISSLILTILSYTGHSIFPTNSHNFGLDGFESMEAKIVEMIYFWPIVAFASSDGEQDDGEQDGEGNQGSKSNDDEEDNGGDGGSGDGGGGGDGGSGDGGGGGDGGSGDGGGGGDGGSGDGGGGGDGGSGDGGADSIGDEPPDYPSPENCVNGEDDDGDGDIDEEDSDCESVEVVIEDEGQGISGTPSSSTAGSCLGNFLTYKNLLSGIQIQYPNCWRLEEVDLDAGDSLSEIAQFYPSPSNLDIVDVGVDNSAWSGLTLYECLQIVINSYRDAYGGVNIEKSQIQATLGGHPAYQLVFSSADGTLKIMETGTIIGDKVYYLRYITEPSKYSVYLPDALSMIPSLTFNR
jgi:hypothetical protein